MVSVRNATAADISTLVEMGRAMHAESPRYSRMAFSAEKVEDLIRSMVSSTLVTEPTGGALVAEKDGHIVGMIGGYIASPFFTHDKVASDYAFYVVPEHRRKCRAAVALMRAFEAWAVEQGAVDIVPGISTMIDPERTLRFFEKLGYEKQGYVLIKRIR